MTIHRIKGDLISSEKMVAPEKSPEKKPGDEQAKAVAQESSVVTDIRPKLLEAEVMRVAKGIEGAVDKDPDKAIDALGAMDEERIKALLEE